MTTKKSPAGARRELLERIQTEGALAGYDAALQVARDPNAPAPAKATAAGLLLRAAGLLDPKIDDLRDKAPAEMTYEELQRSIEELEAARDQDPAGVFD
jgi:hypothetical protein